MTVAPSAAHYALQPTVIAVTAQRHHKARILTDTDASTAKNAATDGTREKRLYHCSNWRGDLVTLINASSGGSVGTHEASVRYSSFGTPTGLPRGDVDGDGLVMVNDTDQIDDWVTFSVYDVRGDLDLDGDVDATDLAAAGGLHGKNAGRGVLFTATLGVIAGTKGYAAYSHDGVISSTIASRRGVIRTDLGRVTVRNDYGCEPRPTIPHCMLKDSLGDYVVFTGGCCPGGSSGGPFNPLFPNEPGPPPPPPPPPCAGLHCSPPMPLPTDHRPCSGPRNPRPGHVPVPNGCGSTYSWWIVPDGLFTDCCNEHDICYASCNCDKTICDDKFLNCMFLTCEAKCWVTLLPLQCLNACRSQAVTYHGFVHWFGGWAYSDAQNEACQ